MSVIRRAYQLLSEDGLVALLNASILYIESSAESIVKEKLLDSIYGLGHCSDKIEK
jgi:DNA-binding transcriptional regulator YhcF (GntR family)